MRPIIPIKVLRGFRQSLQAVSFHEMGHDHLFQNSCLKGGNKISKKIQNNIIEKATLPLFLDLPNSLFVLMLPRSSQCCVTSEVCASSKVTR
jgi:hypothetical protein